MALSLRCSNCIPRPQFPRLRQPPSRTYAASRVTDKTRILEKPTRFNPPSHGSRRVRPRQYPGPRISEQEQAAQKTRRYPNMMPAEGTISHWLLTDRKIHLGITLGTLLILASYSMGASFYHNTIYRNLLPAWNDLIWHPFQTISQFFGVYKIHVAYESEQVAEKRRRKLEDASKRKEFLREHGVEPGFLTGSWMDKFGTEDGDRWKARREGRLQEEEEVRQVPVEASIQGPAAMVAGSAGAPIPEQQGQAGTEGQQEQPRERRKVKKWLGIW